MSKQIKIRGHHLLCMQGFQGYGYSENFVQNFKSIMDRLNNGEKFTVSTGTDDICIPCPHLKNNKCMKEGGSNENIKKIDSQTMTRLDLIPGSKLDLLSTKKLIKSKIKSTRDVDEICGDCPWTKECKWYSSIQVEL